MSQNFINVTICKLLTKTKAPPNDELKLSPLYLFLMAHCVRLIEYAPEITLIFCLRHRCTKNQVLQVFGRIEQEFNGSETLQVSPPKFIFRGRNFVGCLKIPPL